MFKSKLLASVALAALCLPVAGLSTGLPLGAQAAQAQQTSVSFQLFFDQLEPHGVWVRHAKYQYVFCPTGLDATWRPYTEGRWLYLEDHGWYFASDEPFAWATYHYGRWFADKTLGWCWVPGTKWAPAWVSWRRSNDVVGWAPLPPENDGYAVAIEVSRRELPEGYWVFVPTTQFVEPDLSVNIIIGSDQPDYYAQTEFLGPVTVEGDLVINNVIDVTYIEQTINQQVIVYNAEDAADPADQSIDVDAQAIVIFDQDVSEPEAEAAPPEAVEETDAAATIESEGGTAGATAELPPADNAGATPADQPATEQPATEQPATDQATPEAPAPDQPAAEQPAEQPAAPAPEQPVAPETPAAAPTEGGEPAATDPAAAPADDELMCAPEVMVDGKCPPLEGTETPVPEAPAPAEAAPAADAPASPAPEAPAPEVPAPEAPAPEAPAAEPAAPSEQPAAPTETEAPAEEAAPAADDAAPKPPLCPPEVMVDGKCPPLPGEAVTQ
jgi:hypothetical protein